MVSECVLWEVAGVSSSPATIGAVGGAPSDALLEIPAGCEATLPVSTFFDLGAIALSTLATVGGWGCYTI
jgi:hypothetical protein